MDIQRFLYHFPFFRNCPEALQSVSDQFLPLVLERGQRILSPGDECRAIPFLYTGLIRVYQTSETGKELTLYTIGPGESCILTSTCILQVQEFPAHAAAAETLEGTALPADQLRRLMDQSKQWRDFIFQLYGQRLNSVLHLVSAVAFHRLDERLWNFLRMRQEFGKVTLTHGDIAQELGSSREVISRLLKDWEMQGRLSLSRGEITICDLGH